MANVRARGIIIKQTDYGEGNRMLTIFTEGMGIIKAVSYGSAKTKSKTAASSQLLCYGDFELYKSHGREVMTVNNIDTLDVFNPITEDIKKLSLCVYLADITYNLLGENNSDDRLLHIFLNCVYALAYRDECIKKVKAVYEIKMMCAGGYMPSLGGCQSCGSGEVYAFDLLKGGMVCRKCGGGYVVQMDATLYKALDFIVNSEDKRMLSFNAADDIIDRLGKIGEQYVSLQLDMTFKSLGYYKTMLEM